MARTPSPSFEPVASRVTVGDKVYRQLRDALTVGRFDPGQTLTIAALSENFQTSHMPVREALRRLAAEGAVEIRSSGSAHVPKVSRSRLDDIFRARTALERMATEMAVNQITDTRIVELGQIARDHAQLADLTQVYDMLLKNRDFHFGLYRASGSEVLPPLIESLWLQYGPYMRLLSDRVTPAIGEGLHEPFTNGHRAIIEALHNRDAERAGDEVVKDIQRTQALLQDGLSATLD